MNKPKIGIQLYTVRDALAEDFKGTLIKLSELGFRGDDIKADKAMQIAVDYLRNL